MRVVGLFRGGWAVVTELNSGGGREQHDLGGGEGVWVWWCNWYGKRRGLWGRRERERKRVNIEMAEKKMGERGRK